MKIATWNINGVKARIDNLLTWLKDSSPDIACLQEIKSVDETFPRLEIEALGYHVETHGQKGFNGVALLSRTSPDEVTRGLPGDDSDEQARFIEGVWSTPSGVLRVASLYLPNGNPVDTDKFSYKLAWMARLEAHARSRLALEEPYVLAGDYNVIPEPEDCHDPQAWEGDARAAVAQARGSGQLGRRERTRDVEFGAHDSRAYGARRESDAVELHQRFAHRRLAHLQLARQVRLKQLRSGLKVT